jgi:hypothetical protein
MNNCEGRGRCHGLFEWTAIVCLRMYKKCQPQRMIFRYSIFALPVTNRCCEAGSHVIQLSDTHIFWSAKPLTYSLTHPPTQTHTHTHSLTKYSPLATDSWVASREIHPYFRNPYIHYRVHNSGPQRRKLNKLNPTGILTLIFNGIHFHIIPLLPLRHLCCRILQIERAH